MNTLIDISKEKLSPKIQRALANKKRVFKLPEEFENAYKEIEEQYKEIEEQREILRAQIFAYMKRRNQRNLLGEGICVCICANQTGSVFNHAAMKADYPDLYEKYNQSRKITPHIKVFLD